MLNKHLNLTDVQENIKFLLENAPFKLDVKDKVVQELGLLYLPYSTGFEMECDMIPETYSKEMRDEFHNIPNIMEVDVNGGSEQRFRIPKGIDGIVCLFHIADLMRKYAYPNPLSGIHYHVDCTDHYDVIQKSLFMKYKEYILTELDKWNYKGTYNRRTISIGGGAIWVRLQNYFKTMEFRIGEMTFDYSLLLQRIVHVNEIVRTIKSDVVPLIKKYGDNAKNIIDNRKIQI